MDERTLARFLSKVNKNGPLPPKHPELGPCWLWKPAPGSGGYGHFTLNGKPKLAHRVSCEHFNGPIPKGYDVDHLCEVRNCVRPSHLKACTRADNLRRARPWEGGAAFQRDKTECPYGHPYSGDNLRIAKDGSRHCRECDRRHTAEYRARNPPQPKPPKPAREVCANGHPWAENVVIRGGKPECGECSREKVRRYRARQPPKPPKPPKPTCAQGRHPWVPENIYVNPNTGNRACRICHNERTLAAYHARRSA